MSNLAIIGSRSFNDWLLCLTIADEIVSEYPTIDTIVSGGAKGADKLGHKFSRYKRFKYKEFLPNWDKYGKSAGMIRNRTIIDNSDYALIFWDGLSKGTKNSIDLVINKKIPYRIVMVDDDPDLSDKEDKQIEQHLAGLEEWEWVY